MKVIVVIEVDDNWRYDPLSLKSDLIESLADWRVVDIQLDEED